jgi:metal transporter CNNM
MAIVLVSFAGICSGLTVGYLSINELELNIKKKQGDEADIKAIAAIEPILHDHHLLLSTLLLSNAVAMEALPIFLNAIVPSYMAVGISTVAVLVFGEIIP